MGVHVSSLLYVGTHHGLFTAQKESNDWKVVAASLEASDVTSVIAREGVILAGTRNGVMRSDDQGHLWYAASDGLTTDYVRWLAYHPDISDLEFAGTEPADIFVSNDGARTWHAAQGVAPLRDAKHWSLPYSDLAGCVRGFAFSGRRVYAAVEVGGLLVSDDTGSSWRLASASTGDPNIEDEPPPGKLYPDVHSVELHPSSPDLVFTPTGGGFYRSRDGGRTFELLYDCYARACWLDPRDAGHILLGPADHVEENGRIEETRDGGTTWQAASSGVQTPWHDYMVERFFPIGDEMFAVLSNGELLASPIGRWQWQPILRKLADITCVTTL